MRESAEVVAGPTTRKMTMANDNTPTDARELSEIRREVIESRNLVIKTDNLLKNLHAELKMVGKRQEDFQRKTWFSSGVAYVLFVALAITGAVAVSSARSAAANAERERLEKAVVDLTATLDKQRAEASSAQLAARAANEVYRMMTTLPGDERMKGIDALVKLDQAKLSPLEKLALTDRAELLRNEIGQAAFERGKQAFARNEFSATVNELGRFLAMNPRPEDASEALFRLGIAYNQLRKHEQAVTHLTRFITEDRRNKKRDYAMLMLAQSLQETQAYDKAADVVRDALATYPSSEFAPQFRGRLATVKRLAAGGTAEAPAAGEVRPAAAAAPAAAAPAQAQPQAAPAAAPR